MGILQMFDTTLFSVVQNSEGKVAPQSDLRLKTTDIQTVYCE